MAPLKAGAMGSSNDPSTPNEFAASMAAAIEDAYWNSLSADSMHTFDRSSNSTTDRDRRRIFVAIAQGVTGYLQAHADALEVKASGPLPLNTHIEVNVTP
jgi:hypothetical protein